MQGPQSRAVGDAVDPLGAEMTLERGDDVHGDAVKLRFTRTGGYGGNFQVWMASMVAFLSDVLVFKGILYATELKNSHCIQDRAAFHLSVSFVAAQRR